jgi:hypothetical protein
MKAKAGNTHTGAKFFQQKMQWDVPHGPSIALWRLVIGRAPCDGQREESLPGKLFIRQPWRASAQAFEDLSWSLAELGRTPYQTLTGDMQSVCARTLKRDL